MTFSFSRGLKWLNELKSTFVSMKPLSGEKCAYKRVNNHMCIHLSRNVALKLVLEASRCNHVQKP